MILNQVKKIVAEPYLAYDLVYTGSEEYEFLSVGR